MPHSLQINPNQEKLYESENYRIRLVFVNDSESVIVFSEVEDSTRLYEYQLILEDTTNLRNYYPKINVKKLNIATGSVQLTALNANNSSYRER